MGRNVGRWIDVCIGVFMDVWINREIDVGR